MSECSSAPVPTNLAQLNALVQRDLQLLNYPPTDWVVSHQQQDAEQVSDVLIVGAGMCGLSAAFALLRRGVRKLRVVDRNDPGLEGPWLSFARMRTLRSPKHLCGPAQGLPNLTCRAWYEAQWGEHAWQQLERIPRTVWMDYLRWYRSVLKLPVENQICVRRIVAPQAGSGEPFTLELQGPEGTQRALARKVVLATGRESIAAPRVPEAFSALFSASRSVPETGGRNRIQHSAEDIDFAAMHGNDVAVIGIGASAVDNAAAAIEAGAASVHVLARAPAVPRINKAKSIVYAGFTEGFPYLSDAEKLRRLSYIADYRVAPPRHSVLRVAAHKAFQLHMNAGVEQCTEHEPGNVRGRLVLRTANSELVVDHVILATGFSIDLRAAAELVDFQQHIARWSDRVQPRPENRHSEFLQFPYLGPGFEFIERASGCAPYLRKLYCFNYAAAPSHGNVSGDIPSVSDGAERLANGIVRHLFIEDAEHSWQALQDFDDPELLGDELHGVAWWPPLHADDDK